MKWLPTLFAILHSHCFTCTVRSLDALQFDLMKENLTLCASWKKYVCNMPTPFDVKNLRAKLSYKRISFIQNNRHLFFSLFESIIYIKYEEVEKFVSSTHKKTAHNSSTRMRKSMYSNVELVQLFTEHFTEGRTKHHMSE